MTQLNCLKTWRKNKGLTQRELAHGVGVHVQYISDIERGKRRPGMRAAIRIRNYTEGEVSIDALAPVGERA
jgi:transcriptional regulator with XRE-family HTH domain